MQCTAGCSDASPPGGYSCQQQKDWGQCGASWMTQGNFCEATCGRCTQSPAGAAPCAQEKCQMLDHAPADAATVNDPLLIDYPAAAGACDDKQTPWYSCDQQKQFGQCDADWMQQGGFCSKTCGRCSVPAPATPRPAAPQPGAAEVQVPCDALLDQCTKASGNLINNGALPAAPASACVDKETPGYSCAQQKQWGQCGQGWMAQGGYCAKTCGRCTASTPAPRPAGACLSQSWSVNDMHELSIKGVSLITTLSLLRLIQPKRDFLM